MTSRVSDITHWTLTDAEIRVRDGVASGRTVDLAAEVHSDVDGADTRLERAVRATWLGELLAGRTKDPLHPKGLDIRGAQITGPADWHARHMAVPITFRECSFDEDLILDQADVKSLAILNCQMSALKARQLQSQFDLSVDGSRILTETVLTESNIGGAFTATSTEFGNDGTQADAVCFNAEYLSVTSDAKFNDAVAHGEMQLSSAHIGGETGFFRRELEKQWWDGAQR
jgi:hypothetical protein